MPTTRNTRRRLSLPISASLGGVALLVGMALCASQYARTEQARGAITSGPASSGPTQLTMPKGPAAAMAAKFNHDVQPLVQKYCYGCHGNGKKKGDVTLDQFKTFDQILADRETSGG
jgi:hypothetical protein